MPRGDEATREWDRLYKAAIPIEAKRAYNAKWRESVPEEWREAKRLYNRERDARIVAADPLYYAKRRAKDPERTRQRDHERYERHKPRSIANAILAGERRRARLLACRSYRFTRADWDRVQRRFGYACAYCGSVRPLQKDHVIPLTRGGDHGEGNIVPACGSCNKSKGRRTVMEWRHRRAVLAAA